MAEPPKSAKKRTRTAGLIGLFGYTYTDQHNEPGAEKIIQWQFEVIRRMPGTPARYVVQLHSWMDGCATEVKVLDEAYLLSDDVTLYADRDAWHEAYEKECRRLEFQRRAARA